MQDGELGGRRDGTQASAHFEAVHVRQIDIQYDQVCLGSLRQRGASRGGLQHFIARGPQYPAGGVERGGIIVDREYPDRAGSICDCCVQMQTLCRLTRVAGRDQDRKARPPAYFTRHGYTAAQ
jgi:hypothetical protein